MIFLSAPGHHGEPADPTLLEWIGHRIDELVGLSPLALALIFGAVIVAIPLGLATWYLVTRRRHG